MCCSNFRFSVFSPFLFHALLLFSLPGHRLPSNRTRISDVVEKGIGVPTVEDSAADTSLGLASERKPKAPLSAPPGASKAGQNNDVDIIHNGETPGHFEDFVKGPGHISSTILAFWPLLAPLSSEFL